MGRGMSRGLAQEGVKLARPFWTVRTLPQLLSMESGYRVLGRGRAGGSTVVVTAAAALGRWRYGQLARR